MAERGVIETVRMIVRRYPRCRAVQSDLPSREQHRRDLYMSLGFVETGLHDDEFGAPNFKLARAALDVHR